MNVTYHIELQPTVKVVPISRNILSDKLNDFITFKLKEYNTSLVSIHISSNKYYIFIYLEVCDNTTCTKRYDRIDIML